MTRRYALLLVLIGVLCVYLRTLEGPFLWDDRQLVVERLDELARTTPREAFSRPFFQERAGFQASTYYRPLVTLSLAVDARLHGANASGFHLTNVLLHTINTWLLYSLARRWGARPAAAALVASAWALQPRSTEAVAWISGRTDVLATSFVLAALLLYRADDWKRRGTAALLLLFGLLSKEVALAGYAAVLALLWSTRREASGAHPLRSRALEYLPLAASALVYGLLRGHALPNAPGLFSYASGLFRRVPTSAEALGRYAIDICLPWWPRDQQGELAIIDCTYVALGSTVALGLVVGLAFGWRRLRHALEPRVVAYWALGLTSLGLVLHLVPLPTQQVAADRFLYMPTAALALGLSQPLDRRFEKQSWTLWAAIAFVASLAFVAWQRAGEWSNELRFWAVSYLHTPPSNGVPANELANVYADVGLGEHAYVLRKTALGHASYDSDATRMLSRNVAFDATQLGHYEEARLHLEKLCKGATAIDCLTLARLEVREFRFARAREIVQQVGVAAPARAVSEVTQLIEEIEAARGSPALRATDFETRAHAQFFLATRAGRRVEALELASVILASPLPPGALRTAALEYALRFGRPSRIPGWLTHERTIQTLPASLVEIAELRQAGVEEPLAIWPELGVRLR